MKRFRSTSPNAISTLLYSTLLYSTLLYSTLLPARLTAQTKRSPLWGKPAQEIQVDRVERLTPPGYEVVMPTTKDVLCLSPDGSKIACSLVEEAGTKGLSVWKKMARHRRFILDIKTKQLRAARRDDPESAWAFPPVPSPEVVQKFQAIAYPKIEEIYAQYKKQRQAEGGKYYYRNILPSPDGKKAFVTFSFELATAKADESWYGGVGWIDEGGRWKLMFPPERPGRDVSKGWWSPLSDRVVFVRSFIDGNENINPEILIADGQTTKVIARGVALVWAPDGKKLAFARNRKKREDELSDKDREIRRGYPPYIPTISTTYLMNADGGLEVPLDLPLGVVDGYVSAWSANCEIVFIIAKMHKEGNVLYRATFSVKDKNER